MVSEIWEEGQNKKVAKLQSQDQTRSDGLGLVVGSIRMNVEVVQGFQETLFGTEKQDFGTKLRLVMGHRSSESLKLTGIAARAEAALMEIIALARQENRKQVIMCKSYLLFFVCIFVCSPYAGRIFAQSDLVEVPPSKEESFSRWIQSFSDLTVEQVNELLQSDDRTIALNAAWVLVFRDMNEDKEQFQEFGPKKRVSWFLGFMEAKCGVHPPDDWVKLIEEAEYHSDHLRPVKDAMVEFEYKKVGRSYHGSNLTVTRAQKNATIEENNNSIDIEIPEKSSILPSFISGIVLEDISILGFHEGFPTDFQLRCYDTKTGEVAWTNEAWSVIDVNVTFGSGGFHHVTCLKENDAVWIFGATVSGIYCQAHRLDDGECFVRFYSAFFNQRK